MAVRQRWAFALFLAAFALLLGGFAHAQTLPVMPYDEFRGVDAAGNHYDLVIESATVSGYATGRLTLSSDCGDAVVWVSNWGQHANLPTGTVRAGETVRWEGDLRNRAGAAQELVPKPWWWVTCGGWSDWDSYPPW